MARRRQVLDVALGITTSVAGFLEIGSLVTSAQAGGAFGYRLIWAVLLGGVCLAALVEMGGRFAAVSKHTIADALRERFGFAFFLVPLVALLLVGLAVLSAELGGVSAALELATGIDRRVWVLPIALLAWGLLWRGTFGVIENGVSLLSLVTVSFAVAAVAAHPDWRALAAGVTPRPPPHDAAHYWFLAVTILGASISPYLFFFYSSGAIEEKWDQRRLGANRVVSGAGMGFGSLIAVAVLVLGAVVFHTAGIEPQDYRQLPALLTGVFGRTGFVLFVVSLGIACLGAVVEVALANAYLVAQGFGWRWGEGLRPRDDARFCLVYTASLALAIVPGLAGVDLLKLTNVTMALNAATLPVAVAPFLLLMNDADYVGKHGNHWVGNLIVACIVALAFVLAAVSLPLEIAGG
jgi:Mn2+/Fe2+ NRAMP family transporter